MSASIVKMQVSPVEPLSTSPHGRWDSVLRCGVRESRCVRSSPLVARAHAGGNPSNVAAAGSHPAARATRRCYGPRDGRTPRWRRSSTPPRPSEWRFSSTQTTTRRGGDCRSGGEARGCPTVAIGRSERQHPRGVAAGDAARRPPQRLSGPSATGVRRSVRLLLPLSGVVQLVGISR
jgi:hypothetical protein